MLSRHALVFAATALVLAAAATAQETPKCSDLADSPLRLREWHLRGCAAKAGTDFAYAFDVRQNSNNFVRHTLADFPGQTIVGDVVGNVRGIDFDPTATTLYALHDGSEELGTIDLDTGAFTAIGSSAPLPNHSWTGLAIDPVTGIFYASSQVAPSSSSLYTLNPLTGTATLIGTDTDIGIVIDIAVNCLGVIYAHEIVSDSIYTLNPANGQATLVGPTGIDANLPQGMDFDNESGVLYAYIHLPGPGGNNRYGTINLATGEFTTLAANNPTGEFEGASQTTCGGFSPVIFADGFETGDTSRW